MPKILKRLAGFDQIWRGFYGFIGVKNGANSLFFASYGFKPGLTFALFRTSKSHISPQLHRASAHSFFEVNGRRLYFFAQKSGQRNWKEATRWISDRTGNRKKRKLERSGVNMNDVLRVFKNQEFGLLRTIQMDGEVWLAGKDVAMALGYERAGKAIIDHVDEEDRKMIDGKTQSRFGIELGQRGGWMIHESGLYSLILSSRMPTAREFNFCSSFLTRFLWKIIQSRLQRSGKESRHTEWRQCCCAGRLNRTRIRSWRKKAENRARKITHRKARRREYLRASLFLVLNEISAQRGFLVPYASGSIYRR